MIKNTKMLTAALIAAFAASASAFEVPEIRGVPVRTESQGGTGSVPGAAKTPPKPMTPDEANAAAAMARSWLIANDYKKGTRDGAQYLHYEKRIERGARSARVIVAFRIDERTGRGNGGVFIRLADAAAPSKKSGPMIAFPLYHLRELIEALTDPTKLQNVLKDIAPWLAGR